MKSKEEIMEEYSKKAYPTEDCYSELYVNNAFKDTLLKILLDIRDVLKDKTI